MTRVLSCFMKLKKHHSHKMMEWWKRKNDTRRAGESSLLAFSFVENWNETLSAFPFLCRPLLKMFLKSSFKEPCESVSCLREKYKNVIEQLKSPNGPFHRHESSEQKKYLEQFHCNILQHLQIFEFHQEITGSWMHPCHSFLLENSFYESKRSPKDKVEHPNIW